MGTKMTVQFNLFGGTVLKLGTERHHEKLVAGIDTLEEVGCFGLTELGYGNNAVSIPTYRYSYLFSTYLPIITCEFYQTQMSYTLGRNGNYRNL